MCEQKIYYCRYQTVNFWLILWNEIANMRNLEQLRHKSMGVWGGSVVCLAPQNLTNTIFNSYQVSFYDMHSNVSSCPPNLFFCPQNCGWLCAWNNCLQILWTCRSEPLALGSSRWPGCAMDKNSWLQSTKLFSRWSISMEQSAAWNEHIITDTRTL